MNELTAKRTFWLKKTLTARLRVMYEYTNKKDT